MTPGSLSVASAMRVWNGGSISTPALSPIRRIKDREMPKLFFKEIIPTITSLNADNDDGFPWNETHSDESEPAKTSIALR